MVRPLIGGVAVLVLCAVSACGGGSDGEASTASSQVAYHGVPPGLGYPADPVELNAAVDAGDQQAIREHAWAIWAAITTASGEIFNGKPLPLWETWYSGDELYGAIPTACIAGAMRPVGRPFEAPSQHIHAHQQSGDPSQLSEAVTSMNRFTAELAQHVCTHKYNQAATLNALNASFTPSTPLAARAIDEFPVGAIAIKPVFSVVQQSGITILPYWNGTSPSATSDPSQPGPMTWKQCVAVVPPGTVAPASPYRASCNAVANYPAPVVSIDRFYHFQLTPAEVDQINQHAILVGVAPRAGDYVVLVAMHLTTKELPRWTWQTYWWTPTPDDASPDNANRPQNVRDEWRSYSMCAAYSMVDPPQSETGVPVICFNPYLETTLSDIDGAASNCMTCHRLAAWPNFSTPYVASGYIPANDPQYFATNLKLDFLWSITRAH